MVLTFNSYGVRLSAKYHYKGINLLDWHRKQLKWWKKKMGVSDYGIAWISFLKGVGVGVIIYHFFIA